MTAGRRTGVAVECFQTTSAAKADKSLRDALTRGPVMIRVDMGFLPYLNLPQGYHFGGHVVVVAGLDADGKAALIADRHGKLHSVSLKDLARARGSKFKPFPPRNALFTFDFSAKRSPTAGETRQAIAEAAKGMLHAPISNLGVGGIRKAAACVIKWPKMMGVDDVRKTCFNAFIFIDATGGTGGGIFRYMYSRFLKEAAKITGECKLEGTGRDMFAIGDQWQEAARLFKELVDSRSPATGLSEVSRLLNRIADQEETAWQRLAALACFN